VSDTAASSFSGPDSVDVAIVGGGPAGAALAIRLADRGISSVIVEYAPEPRWRACGVFSSPLSRGQLRELALSALTIAELNRPIAALDLASTRGVHCRIEYDRGYACGFDRPRLDAVLLDRAREAGVNVRMATNVRSVDLPSTAADPVRLTLVPTSARRHGDTRVVKARLVVGAAGSGFVLGGTNTAQRSVTRLRKSGMTVHRADPGAAPAGEPMEGRFLFGHRWYIGVAPVPRERVNLGMVFPRTWLQRRPDEITREMTSGFAARGEPGPAWLNAENTDEHRIAGALNHGVKRVAGDRWLLVGDATGFIDPLTGEGLHRAFVSSEMAADAIEKSLRGDRNAMRDYDRRLRSRFRSKDIVSWILQGFLAQPQAFDYALRRLARRHGLRRTLTLVLTDQLPAARALDPRFLTRLLAP
jgi:flavin-dependent dehydrogenase